MISFILLTVCYLKKLWAYHTRASDLCPMHRKPITLIRMSHCLPFTTWKKKKTPVICTWSVCTLLDIIAANCTGWHVSQDRFASVLRLEGRAEEHFLYLQPSIHYYYLEALFQLKLIILCGSGGKGVKEKKKKTGCTVIFTGSFYSAGQSCGTIKICSEL